MKSYHGGNTGNEPLSLRDIISSADHRDHHANWILENTNVSQVLANLLDKQIEQIEIIFPG